MFNIHIRTMLMSLCVLILLTSVVMGISSGNDLRWPDAINYNRLAENILAGKGYVNEQNNPTAFRPPGYPYILSAIYSIWDHPLAPKLVNSFALALTGWFLASIVTIISPRGAIFSPLLILFSPLLLYTSTTLLATTLGTLFFVSSLYSLIRFPKSLVSPIISGIIYGILIYLIPYFLMVLPLITILMFFAHKKHYAQRALFPLLFFLCVILTVSPWSIRNYITFGKFVPVSTNSGINLLLGNSENTRPNSGTNVDLSHYYETSKTRQMNEIERDAYFRESALSWVTGHPIAAFQLYVRKVLNYFNYRNELSTKSEQSNFRELVLFISYYPLLALVLVRIILWRRYLFLWPELLMYTLYFGNAFTSAIFFTRIRFRIPFDALLIAMVSIFLGYLLDKSYHRKVYTSSTLISSRAS